MPEGGRLTVLTPKAAGLLDIDAGEIVRPGILRIKGNRIAGVGGPPQGEIIDLGNLIVLPMTVEEGIADGIDQVRRSFRYQIARPEFLYRYSGQTKAGIACLRMKMTIPDCQRVTRPER